jgi:hypothetical protein
MDLEKTQQSSMIQSFAIPLLLIFAGLNIFVASVSVISELTLTGVILGYSMQVVGIWLLSAKIYKITKSDV